MSAEVPQALAASLKCMDQTVRILNIDCLAAPGCLPIQRIVAVIFICHDFICIYYCLPLRQKVRFIYR